jgi:hypothetical protein
VEDLLTIVLLVRLSRLALPPDDDVWCAPAWAVGNLT